MTKNAARLELEGRVDPVVDVWDNVWRRNKSNEPWRSCVSGEAVYKMDEDMDPWVREIGDELTKYVS